MKIIVHRLNGRRELIDAPDHIQGSEFFLSPRLRYDLIEQPDIKTRPIPEYLESPRMDRP
jgi:hypothetical protein